MQSSPEPEEEQHHKSQSHMQMSDIPMRDRLSESERERVESWIQKHNEAVERAEREHAQAGSSSG